MKPFLSAIVFAVAAAIWGCRNPFAPDQSVVLDVTQLDAPTTISTGSPLSVVLTVVTGGCKSFDHIEAQRQAASASLTAWGRDGAKGRKDIMCPDNIVYEPHSYRFEPPFQSPFTVTVNRGRLSPLIATVQVQ